MVITLHLLLSRFFHVRTPVPTQPVYLTLADHSVVAPPSLPRARLSPTRRSSKPLKQCLPG